MAVFWQVERVGINSIYSITQRKTDTVRNDVLCVLHCVVRMDRVLEAFSPV